jgi:hypothetical protein
MLSQKLINARLTAQAAVIAGIMISGYVATQTTPEPKEKGNRNQFNYFLNNCANNQLDLYFERIVNPKNQ